MWGRRPHTGWHTKDSTQYRCCKHIFVAYFRHGESLVKKSVNFFHVLNFLSHKIVVCSNAFTTQTSKHSIVFASLLHQAGQNLCEHPLFLYITPSLFIQNVPRLISIARKLISVKIINRYMLNVYNYLAAFTTTPIFYVNTSKFYVNAIFMCGKAHFREQTIFLE